MNWEHWRQVWIRNSHWHLTLVKSKECSMSYTPQINCKIRSSSILCSRLWVQNGSQILKAWTLNSCCRILKEVCTCIGPNGACSWTCWVRNRRTWRCKHSFVTGWIRNGECNSRCLRTIRWCNGRQRRRGTRVGRSLESLLTVHRSEPSPRPPKREARRRNPQSRKRELRNWAWWTLSEWQQKT